MKPRVAAPGAGGKLHIRKALDARAELVAHLRADFAAIASDCGFADAGQGEAPDVASVLFDRVAGCGYDSLSREAFELAQGLSESDRVEIVRRSVL